MPSVSDFLIERLENIGLKHVFGVPGDYVLNFYKKLSLNNKIKLVNCTDESHAGFAASSYARASGIGCVCTTYNVGTFKTTNSIAASYAERCPVVVISGSPGLKERSDGLLLSHMVRSFECQKNVFDNLTCASVVLDDPTTAGYKIDAALAALQHHKQPIYIELPSDIADKIISYDVYRQGTPSSPKSDQQNLEESLEEVSEWIRNSKNPVILAGVQLSRYGFGNQLIKFAEKTNIPIATTLLAKSLVDERHQLFIGTYAGEASKEEVKNKIEESDCLLVLGVLSTDTTLRFMPSKFKKRNIVNCSVETLQIKNHTYTDVQFQDFCNFLFKKEFTKKSYEPSKRILEIYEAQPNRLITAERFFNKINSILNENYAVITDVGDCLFGASDLLMHNKSTFIGSAFYSSMGGAIPGTLGVGFSKPDKRIITLVGDGAFQMSCTELSTIVANKMNPIIFVLNNGGYTTERFVLEGSYNDINNWKYSEFVKVIGGNSHVVKNEVELDQAINFSIKSKEMSLIEVCLDKNDTSLAFKRLIEGKSKRI